MAYLTEVGVTAGVPTSGTGEVFTLNTVNATIASTNTKLDTVNTNLTTIDGRVDGIEALIGTSNTALQLIDDTVVTPGTAIGATKNSLVGGSVTTAAPTYTNGQVSPLNLDTAGNLRVNVAAGGASGGTASTVGAAAPGTATAVGFSDGTNMVLGRVKAASTAPVAADPALVVAISPNSVNANGQTTMANSAPVVLASNHSTVPTSNTNLTDMGAGEYETVAASQTAQAIGATGATGDYISHILVIPATTSPGLVTLLDNATSIPVFVGGTVSDIKPFLIPLCMRSVSGAWKITTGANVSCIAVGNFT